MKSKKKSCAISRKKEGAIAPSSPRRKKRVTLSEGFFEKRTDCWKVLRPLQKGAVEFTEQRSSTALLFKQRLGKTYIAAGVVERLRPECTLIIVPLTNKESTWSTKLQELVPHIPVSTPTRQGKKRLLATLEGFQNGVFLVSFEAFCSIIKKLVKMPWDLIIVDEAQRAKDRASLFSRCLSKLRKSFARKLLLSGTPIEDRPQDIWAQLRFAAPEIFGTVWKEFDEEYLEQSDIDLKERNSDGRLKYPPGSVRWKRALMKMRIDHRKAKMREDKLPKFIRKIKDVCWREELPGPEPRFHTIKIRMYGYQRQVYEILDRKGVVRLDDGTKIQPPIEIAKRIKLRQVTSGFVYDEDGNVHDVGRAKLRALKVLLAKLPKPVVVFSLYVPEIEQYLEEFPKKTAALWGRTPREKRKPVQDRFQAGKLDYLFCQERTGGVGIDLFRAKAMVVTSANYSSIDFDQMISRIRLPDQKDPVDIFLLIAVGTIDEERNSSVFGKNRRVSKVLQQLRRTVK